MFKKVKGDFCLNCDTEVKGMNYCPECGQANDTRRLTFISLIGESLSNFLAVDGRIFRTISSVLTKPGQAARLYKEGKRMRFMNPVRFYFLASVLLISSIQFSRDKEIVKYKIDKDQIQAIERLSPEEKRNRQQKVVEQYQALEEPDFFDRFRALTNYLSLDPGENQAEAFVSLGIERSFWNEFAYAQAHKASKFAHNQEDNFEDFNRKLISQLFWILFLFIPLLGEILNLLYFRRDIYYPEHLFFTLYQQGLFFLIAFLLNLITDNEKVFIAFLLAFGLHLMLAMKNFYQQTWSKTVLKFILINIFGIAAFIGFFILALIFVFILL